jgi:type I restriction enzyme S subunit
MTLDTFFEKFELLADAPDAEGRMRELVLALAVQGKLVEQTADCGDARDIFKNDKPVAGDARYPIPKSWLWIRFASVGEQRLGKMLDQNGNRGALKPYLRNKNLQWERFKLDDLKELRLEDHELDEYRLRSGDLLICEGGEPGRCAIWKDEVEEMYFQKAIHRVRPRVGIVADYLALCLRVGSRDGSLVKHFTGATIKHLTGRSLRDYSIPLPPLAEQKRIVAKVEELMALCDRLESQQQERATRHAALARASLSRFAEAPTPANLHLLFHPSYDIPPAELRKAILTLAVQGKLVEQDAMDDEVGSVGEFRREAAKLASSLGIRAPKESAEIQDPPFEIPDPWIWMTLADICVAQTGTTPSKDDPGAFNGDIPFVKPADIYPATINYSNESLTREGAEKGSRLAPPGSLLMVCIGTIGKCNITERECAFNQQINSASPVEAVEPRYLLLVARSSYFQEAAWAKSASTTIAILNKGNWLSIPVPIPPLAEQRRIVAKVEQLMALMDRLETRLTASRDSAGKLLEAVATELTAEHHSK